MAETNLGFQMFLPLLGQAMVGVPMGYLRQQVEALWEARDAANLIWEAEGEPDEGGGRYRKSPKLAQADAEAKKRERSSAVEFILGDVTQRQTLERIGPVDVVFCAGVLYHHPSPFDLLAALRALCRQTLILRSSMIPEIKGLPNAAVYFPMLKPKDRALWDLTSLGVPRQVGITDAFEPDQGYGNWFWGLTPSCLASLLETAGFRVEHRASEAFAQTFVCTPVEVPFAHTMPDVAAARRMGETVSSAGIARPA